MTWDSATAAYRQEYADQRGHDAFWMTAEERAEHDRHMAEIDRMINEGGPAF